MVIEGAPKGGGEAATRPEPKVLDLPYAGFDPLNPLPGQLEQYGLPLPLDARFPLYNAFRARLLGPGPNGGPINWVEYREMAMAGGPPGWTTIPRGGMPAERSRNWSGAYLRPSGGRSFVRVMGSWTIPQVKRPAGATGNEYLSSTWIGLDGQGSYLHSSLPQIGTAQEWKNGAPEAPYAWYQWWARGFDTTPVPLTLQVSAGDRMFALLTRVDERTVRFNLRNDTTTSVLQAFDVTQEESAPGQLLVSGATVEWIMERPAPEGTDGAELYDLPAYKDFSFTDCLAHSALGSGAPVEHDLNLAQAIRMYQNLHNPPSTPTVSTARIVRPQQIDLEYVPPYGEPKPTFP